MIKCQSVIYINKEDPRIFVYKHQKWKWVGVTLNFAHTKSLGIFFVTLGSAAIPLFPLLIFQKSYAILPSLILFVLWLVALIWYYYREAAKDIQLHPGNPSVR